MFSSDFKDSKSPEIEFKDFEPDSFKVILMFIYTNRIPKNFEHIAVDLLVASHMFQLNVLTKVCESQLCKTITLHNCLDLLLFADLYNQNELKEAVIVFVGRNFKDIRKTDPWKTFSKNHMELTIEVLEGALSSSLQ